MVRVRITVRGRGRSGIRVRNEKRRGGGSSSLPFCRFLFSGGSDESVSFRSSIESDGST